MKKRLCLKRKSAEYFIPLLDHENKKALFNFIKTKSQQFRSFDLSENELLLQSFYSIGQKNSLITSDIRIKVTTVLNGIQSRIEVEYRSGLPTFMLYYTAAIYMVAIFFAVRNYLLQQKIQLIVLLILSIPFSLPILYLNIYLQMKKISSETDLHIRSFFPHLLQGQYI